MIDLNLRRNLMSIILICIISILVAGLLFFLLIFNNTHSDNNDNNQFNNAKELNKKEIIYENFTYKIIKKIGTDTYNIYLLDNEVIKVVKASEIFDIVPQCDCIQSTGEYAYSEYDIKFDSDVKKQIIILFDELYKTTGKREYNINDAKLTDYQERIISAIILNKQDKITIEKEFKYTTIEKNILSSNQIGNIKNTMTILNDSTTNITLNKIAKHLNDIISKDYEQYNKTAHEMKDTITEEGLGVELKFELVYIGPLYISFLYTIEGQLGATPIYEVKGYSFDYSGKIKEFNANGLKEKYFNSVTQEFLKIPLVKENKDYLYKSWSEIMYDNMYKLGNWYISENKIVFLILASLLGFDESTSKIITIEVEADTF